MARRNGNRCKLRTALLVAFGTGLLVVAFNLVQMHHLVGRQPARADRKGLRARMLGATQDASDPAPRFGAGNAADEALAQVVIVTLSDKTRRVSGYSLSLVASHRLCVCGYVTDHLVTSLPPSLPLLMLCVQSYCRLPDVPLEQEWVSYLASLPQPSSVPLCDPRYIYICMWYSEVK